MAAASAEGGHREGRTLDYGRMRVIGVIDLKGGRAVHARGGQRDGYAPVRAAADMTVHGDALALGRVFVETLGVRELYVADLDAIVGGLDAMHSDVIGQLSALDVPLWVDAGTSTAREARAVRDAGASTVIVGLETLTSFGALGETCAEVGGAHVAFSLDLQNGEPVVLPNGFRGSSSAVDLAARAAAVGVGSVIVLDLARVGMGVGIDVTLMETIRAAAPGVVLLAGGGLRNSDDLGALAAVGCDGALVATALLNGAVDVSAWRRG